MAADSDPELDAAFQTCADPFLFAPNCIGIYAAFSRCPHQVFPRDARFKNVGDFVVHGSVLAIAEHHAAIFIIEGEAFRQCFNGI